MSWKGWKGKQLARVMRDAVAKGLVVGGEVILADSQTEVPLDEGTLQLTGGIFVDPSDKLSVSLSYGGGNGTGYPIVPYAKKWHETPANFQKGRKHNYVRDPINRGKTNQTVERAIATELRSAL
jgi:hypothetical protein